MEQTTLTDLSTWLLMHTVLIVVNLLINHFIVCYSLFTVICIWIPRMIEEVVFFCDRFRLFRRTTAPPGAQRRRCPFWCLYKKYFFYKHGREPCACLCIVSFSHGQHDFLLGSFVLCLGCCVLNTKIWSLCATRNNTQERPYCNVCYVFLCCHFYLIHTDGHYWAILDSGVKCIDAMLLVKNECRDIRSCIF